MKIKNKFNNSNNNSKEGNSIFQNKRSNLNSFHTVQYPPKKK